MLSDSVVMEAVTHVIFGREPSPRETAKAPVKKHDYTPTDRFLLPGTTI